MAEERRKIVELSKQTADKIAAGEVIERPLSIVKELVENSIDAGSTSIVVEIRNGGKSYIRVTDDGCGIRADETELAFKRHATSKLRTVKDLDTIGTLGFRGEALASISAVSRVELITRTADAEAGTLVQIEGGVTASVSETGCPAGTTIIVKDLFFNTPARLKFLKKDSSESLPVTEFMSRIALAYPGVRIRYINNGSTLFSTQGKGDLFSTIATIYDPGTAKKLLKLSASDDKAGISVDGYISPPSETRANRRSQIFFVNGRSIESRLLENCVKDGYREKVFEGRHPVVFMFVNIRPDLVDVNIHPNKKEVRFHDDAAVREFITQAVRNALRVQDAVPEFTFKKDRAAENKQEKPVKAQGFVKQKQEQLDIRDILRQKRANEEAAAYSASEAAGGKTSDSGRGSAAPAGSVNAGAEAKSGRGDASKANAAAGELKGGRDNAAKAESAAAEANGGRGDAAASQPAPAKAHGAPAGAEAVPAEKEERPSALPAASQKAPESRFMPHIEPAASRPFDISAIRPVGTIFASYILGCDDDTFYMIDQHAAHERVFYERLTVNFYGQQTASQILGLPIQVNVSHAVKNMEDEWIGFLRNTGFAVEEFGPRAYAVKEIPAYMDDKEAEMFIKDFFDSIDEPGAFRDKRRADKIITRACKSAVKANDSLDMAEIKQLLRDLAKTENPFSCPHGRPTVIRMTKREIEALFKR